MKSAYEYWTSKFGEPPQNDNEKLAVAMMAEYGREMYNQAIEDCIGEKLTSDGHKRLVNVFLKLKK